MRICIADSQARVRHGLRILLEQQPGWKVAGEAASGTELLHCTQECSPDLLLLDWDLPGMPAETLIKKLRKQCPRMAVVVMCGDQALGPLAIQCGANTFTWKAESPVHLLELIRSLQPDPG